MKNLKTALVSTLFISLTAFGQILGPEDCVTDRGIPEIAPKGLIETLQAASKVGYVPIVKVKVNMDGEGELLVQYENGVPKRLRMVYDGKIQDEIDFDDLAAGKPLTYENSDKPGKAMIIEKRGTFQNGKIFSINFRMRSGINPDKYTSFPIDFESDQKAPKTLTNGTAFSSIILSPGVKMFSWDGTFKKAEFK